MTRSTTPRLLAALVIALLAALSAAALTVRHQRLAAGQVTTLPPPSWDTQPARPFGINYNPAGLPPSEYEAAFADIAATGFGWVRIPFNWQSTNLQAAKATVNAANDAGLQVIAVLSADNPAAAPDPGTFAAFAGEFAAAVADDVRVYQVWDEPNLASAWGGDADPAGYARLLQASHAALRNADPDAHVLLAGLAPTLEEGPANLSDIIYLEELYALGADAYFDAVAAKPYGFDTSADSRDTAPGVLGVGRMVALRRVMVQAGDSDSLLWASHFGWNSLPDGWAGHPSVWGQRSLAVQADETIALFARAAREWPWAGVLVLERYDTAGLAPDDARAGFAVNGRPAWDALGAYLPTLNAATAGNHSADTGAAAYSGDWSFSALGADIPETGPATMTLDFYGSDVAVIARRDNYRAYLWATVDGAPANALPVDAETGRAYAVLTSGDYLPHTETLWLAKDLSPGPHTLVIEADRGWQQWAIAGFTVATPYRDPTWPWLPLLLGVVALAALVVAGRTAADLASLQPLRASFDRLGSGMQVALTFAVGAAFWAGAWLTWGADLANTVRRYGDTLPLLLTLASAGTFYFSPWLLLTLASALLLLLLLYLRPPLALPLIAFAIPFYLQPRPLFERVFSVVEIVTLLAALVLLLVVVTRWRERRFQLSMPTLTPLDWGVLLFVLLGAGGVLSAAITGVALTEFRTMVIEPAIVYALLRVIPLTPREIWRAVDFWILGAVVVAAIGLWEYALGIDVITAEGGIARLRSVYGSPNNVGLYLGRVIPVAAAIVLLGGQRWRRWLYGGALLLLLPAVVLSFSRGALLLGIPAALALVFLFWQRRRAVYLLLVAAVAGALSLIPLSRVPRFASLFDFSAGGSFFRLNLWRSALRMVADHPLTGVGLDNFLYAYRGRYIAPAAWQDPNLSHAHNWLLDYAARLGLPGLVVGVWLLVQAMLAGWRAAMRQHDPALRALAIGLMASLVDFMAHGLVDASYWFIDLAFAFMLTLGLLQWLAHHAGDATDVNE